MALFENPFTHPNMAPFLIRVGILLATGLVIMVLTQMKDLKKMLSSNGFKKFCSWLVIVPALMGVIYGGIAPFLALVLFMLWKASSETMKLMNLPPFYRRVFTLNGLITAGVMLFSPKLTAYLPALYMIVVFVAAAIRNQTFNVLPHVSFTVVGSIWICWFLSMLPVLYTRNAGSTRR